VAFHCKLHLGVLCVYVLDKLLLGWNFVLCLLDMRNMRLLGKKREVFTLYETKTINSNLENFVYLLTFKFRWKFKTIGTKYPCVYSHPVFFG
jgi:hypothetical protein